jgi:foldase protein PrsA
MRNVKKIISAALITMFATSFMGCNMIAKTSQGIANTQVANVFGTKITKGQVDEQLVGYIKQLQTQYGANYTTNTEATTQLTAQKQQVLNGLIGDKIIDYKVAELKLMPSNAILNEQVNNQITQIKKSLGTDAKYKEALTQANITENELKARIKPSVIQNILYIYATKNVKVTQAQAESYYKANPIEFTDGTIHAAQIVVATEAEAKDIKKSLDNGGDFAKIAKAKSTDRTKVKGGDLGTLKYNGSSMDKTFMASAIKLKQGTISEPVKDSDGYHIIKSIQNKSTPEKKFAAVKDSIETTLLTTAKINAWTAAMKEWQTEAKIVINAKNL